MKDDPRGLTRTNVAAIEQEKYKRHQICMAFTRLFATEDGKEVMKQMRAMFYDVDVASKDEFTTVVRGAKRDVVQWLLTNIELGKEDSQ